MNRIALLILGAATALFASTFARADQATIEVHAGQILHRVSRYLTGACLEDVNHEVYGGIDSQMIFGESFQEPPRQTSGISGMWRGFRRGTVTGAYGIETNQPFLGQQSQWVTLAEGSGSLGIENQGLNRWGMNWQAGKVYEGYLWVRAETGLALSVALESGDEAVTYAETPLAVTTNGWQRLEFQLTPTATDATGRFAIELKTPGTVELGYALIQPGDWGRFKGLPVRKDVGEGLVNQGVTVMRYGGCMANAAGYRWKNMIGPRDRRPPYAGWWYPHSSNGWGIPDFLNFCEAAGFVGIPDVNINETPQDLADLVEYMNGPADSEWGQRRVADGHPAPYRAGWLELGNEEKVNEDYWRKFEPVAKAIWARDPKIILVVGDFSYHQPLPNPFDFQGADGGITNLAVQQKILRLAKANGREVWFDIHLNTDGSQPEWGGVITYVDALDRLAEGARHRVVIFELNAGIHSQRRALANALAINALERDGRVPIVTSANALQPDGQNDNDWNQGLLFFNPTQTWLQPPGYVTQMISRHFQPLLVKADVSPAPGNLDATATLSEDGHTLVLQVVNVGDQPESTELSVDGFAPAKPTAEVEELSADPAAVNTARQPDQIIPRNSVWTHSLKEGQGQTQYTFQPHSFTLMVFE